MTRITGVCLLLLFFPNYLLAQELNLKPGLSINKSVKIRKKTYPLSASGENAAIVIEGNNITIDFSNATLSGNFDGTRPDQFTGIAVEVRNSRKVTIRNLKVKGFKVALLAKNVDELVIENCDLSYNYRPRLQSTQQKEDLSDWLSYHRNDSGEWLGYGAGIYLSDCKKAKITGCRSTNNQNGLLMSRCEDATIINNDFSFNSGLGIGLYRSSANRVLYNRLVFNIRGYSHGVYQRGQDSAGILVFEQSSNNLFFENNVTHGGDGFFLWAGNSTMETGKGGCNGNLIRSNNFSYAATNGIELTFSSNIVDENRVFECENGIWGGYSYNTIIRNNRFRQNKVAVAIEHGQDNSISYNLFDRDTVAIKLWQNASVPTDWGYARIRDTKSRDYRMIGNSFNRNNTVFDLKNTNGLNIFSNTFSGAGTIYKTDDRVDGIDSVVNSDVLSEEEHDTTIVVTEPKTRDPYAGSNRWPGRRNIRMTEWGPYNFDYPIIWNRNPVDTSKWMEFELFGPAGAWIIKDIAGLDSVSVRKGSFPATIRAKKRGGETSSSDLLLRLEYRGKAFADPFGRQISAKTRYPFEFRRYFKPLAWKVLFFSLDTAFYNPLREQGLFSPTARMAPVKRDTVQELNYAWWGGLKLSDRVLEQFITVAETPVEKGGNFELSVTWQGAVRVYVDDKIVLDAWKLEKKVADEADNRRVTVQIIDGQTLRVEHLGFAGFSALAVKLLPAAVGGKK